MKKKNIYNKNDIKHFNSLYSEWWDKNGALKTLHAINPTRMEYINSICNMENKLILDIGCGGGILSLSMAKHKANVIGIDPSKKLIQIANEHSKNFNYNLKFLNVTLEEYVQKVGNKFDIITCMELIEHVKQPEIFISMIKPLLKKDSVIFFSTINRNLSSYFKSIFFAEYILNIIPKGTHNFKNFIRPSELNNMLNKINYNIISLQGFSYNPITNKSNFCEDVTCNYMSCFKEISNE